MYNYFVNNLKVGEEMEEKRILAFDFGASSGRAVIGRINNNTIEMEEIHRFSNDPVVVNGVVYWDILRLFHEIKQGIIKAKHAGGFHSIGIDTWGVDFGLLDKNGNLLENPIHYRDKRTVGMIDKSFNYIERDQFYDITGNQFLELNTAFQLLSLAENRPELLDRTDTLLLIPDLFAYMLTGVKKTEYSIASTTQLMDAKNCNWSDRVMDALNIPKKIFTEIIPCGSIIGNLSEEICTELGVPSVPIVAVASHDTQSAMIAVPTDKDDFAFLSCGTWSLLGTELESPIINEKSMDYNITNEGGYGYKASFLKNIIGLWLIQESRRQWIRDGQEYSFSELEKMAMETTSKNCYIDPDDPVFSYPGNIPKRIREYCKNTGQDIPETVGEIVLCINESLALKYRKALEEVEDCTNKKYSDINIIGGGIQSKLLCQFTANSCGRKVIAGPVEATVLGNLSIQFIALNIIKDIKEARSIISKSDDIVEYNPENQETWNKKYIKFMEVIK